ncbi:MAG: hypothetical protein ACYSUI_06300 [Planctomycetota bacterium]|jgi:hypothetical protein
MKFRIIGAERQTGHDVDTVIEAPTPSAAEEQANQMNLLVERIEAADQPDHNGLLPHLSVDVERGEVEVRASMGRLARSGHTLVRAYVGCWKRKTAVTSLSHLCLVLAAGWFGSALFARYPRGTFPPFNEVKQILNEEKYFRADVGFTGELLRGRSTLATSFVRDATQHVGIIKVHCDVEDRERVIALTTHYKHYPLLERLALLRNSEKMSELAHGSNVPAIVRQFTGASLETIELTKDEAEPLSNHMWFGQLFNGGFRIDVICICEGPPSQDASDSRSVLLLDRSFQ